MSGNLTVADVKKKIAEILEAKKWSVVEPKKLIDLVVGGEPFRSSGNRSAHRFTKEEKEEAISSGGGKWKTQLQALYDNIYR